MSAEGDALVEAAEAAWGAYMNEHGYATVPTSPDTGADFSAGFEAGVEWGASHSDTDERVEAAVAAIKPLFISAGLVDLDAEDYAYDAAHAALNASGGTSD